MKDEKYLKIAKDGFCYFDFIQKEKDEQDSRNKYYENELRKIENEKEDVDGNYSLKLKLEQEIEEYEDKMNKEYEEEYFEEEEEE